MKNLIFNDFNFSKEMHLAINDLGYEEATPIQSQAIPVFLEGKDIIGQAQTGTGKTAAFGIPILEIVKAADKSIQCIILCPTRELAIQVSEEMCKLAKYKKDIAIIPIYGGQSIDRQLKGLKKGVQIIIGTPGRILDHLDRRTIKPGGVKIVVLDEADEMLDMGFRDDIELILKTTPSSRQTVLFSATMHKSIVDLAKKYQRDPVNIKVVHEVLTVPNTEQIYFEVREREKLESLSRIIDLYNLKLSLIFCNTKRGVDELVDHLQARGYSAEGLHGDMQQNTRERVTDKFRNGKIDMLVATDVAARGLDIDNIEAVFNYDMPQNEDYYVHRIGRTGRMGKTGKAFTFATSNEIFKLRIFQKYIKTKIKLQQLPTYGDVEEMKENIFLGEIKEVIKKGDLKKYTHLVENLINEDYTSLEIAAALIKICLPPPVKEPVREFIKEGKPENGRDKRRDTSRKGSKERFSKPNTANSKEVRLFLNVGKKDKVRPGDILGALAGESGLPGNLIGDIDMYDSYSFVNVPGNYSDKIIDSVSGCKIKGKKVHIEEATGK
ncbi:MAG: DEAD/DEAH box helicase [Ignavibacteriaceae bacterium]|nr:DEAD/DEAH box helicase [Ignavibacteriaceae bacterium]